MYGVCLKTLTMQMRSQTPLTRVLVVAMLAPEAHLLLKIFSLFKNMFIMKNSFIFKQFFLAQTLEGGGGSSGDVDNSGSSSADGDTGDSNDGG
jgi:hypothetical protein